MREKHRKEHGLLKIQRLLAAERERERKNADRERRERESALELISESSLFSAYAHLILLLHVVAVVASAAAWIVAAAAVVVVATAAVTAAAVQHIAIVAQSPADMQPCHAPNTSRTTNTTRSSTTAP